MKKGDQVVCIGNMYCDKKDEVFTIEEILGVTYKLKGLRHYWNKRDFKSVDEKPEEKPKQEIDYFLSYRGKGNPIEPVYKNPEVIKTSRLDEIKEEVAKEYGFRDYQTMKVHAPATKMFKAEDEVTRRYAKECISATIKKITDENAYHVNNSEEGVVHCVEVCDILDSDNFVFL